MAGVAHAYWQPRTGSWEQGWQQDQDYWNMGWQQGWTDNYNVEDQVWKNPSELTAKVIEARARGQGLCSLDVDAKDRSSWTQPGRSRRSRIGHMPTDREGRKEALQLEDHITLVDAGLAEVHLSNTELRDDELADVVLHLRGLFNRNEVSFVNLDLSCNWDVTDKGILTHLVPFLEEFPACQTLKLYRCSVGDVALAALSPWIASGHVRELHFSDLGMPVTRECVFAILREIHRMQQYPYNKNGSKFPLWLRLDHNGIIDPDTVLSQVVADGLPLQISDKRGGSPDQTRVSTGSQRSTERLPAVTLVRFHAQRVRVRRGEIEEDKQVAHAPILSTSMCMDRKRTRSHSPARNTGVPVLFGRTSDDFLKIHSLDVAVQVKEEQEDTCQRQTSSGEGSSGSSRSSGSNSAERSDDVPGRNEIVAMIRAELAARLASASIPNTSPMKVNTGEAKVPKTSSEIPLLNPYAREFTPSSTAGTTPPGLGGATPPMETHEATRISSTSDSIESEDSDDKDQEQEEWWVLRPTIETPLAIRSVPDINGPVSGHALVPGETFLVRKGRVGVDGVIYLKLSDGRGWVFDSKPGVGQVCEKCKVDNLLSLQSSPLASVTTLESSDAPDIHQAMRLEAETAAAEAASEVERMETALREMAQFIAIEPQRLNDAVKHVASIGWNNIAWRRGYTALHLAGELGRDDVVPLLVGLGADVLAEDEKGRSAFDIAKKKGHGDGMTTLKRLMQEKRDRNEELLQEAAQVVQNAMDAGICPR